MAQLPLPPFTTGIDVKLALSAAFSTQFNSRGLEATYSPAWIATLHDACSFSNRLSVATEPYLSIPGVIINRLELSSRHQELLQKRRNLDAAWEKEGMNNPTSSRQSARIPLLSEAKRAKEDVALQKAEREWRHENRSAKQDLEGGNVIKEVDFSFDISTVNDSDAKDSRPDVSVAHIVGGTIRMPTMEDVQERYEGNEANLQMQLNRLISQYTARAGIKIIHRCGVLIGEFKRVPARNEADIIGLESTDLLVGENAGDGSNTKDEDVNWLARLNTSLLEAIEDTMRYCAIHFLIHPFASEIITLASAGPFWKWTTVKKEQVPSFNWLTGLPVESPKNVELRVDFVALFDQISPDYLVLATAESDAQINKMRNVMFNLINHPDPPTLPTDFGFTLIPDAPKAASLP